MLDHWTVILKKIKWNGAYEWILVRFSAILILVYIVYVLYFIMNKNILTYEEWYNFFSKKTTKIFNVVTLLSIIIHSWIGISHVLMDYIKNVLLKYIFKFIIIAIFFIYLFCGISVIWGT